MHSSQPAMALSAAAAKNAKIEGRRTAAAAEIKAKTETAMAIAIFGFISLP